MKITDKTRKSLIILFTLIGYTAGAAGVFLKWKDMPNANGLLIVAIVFVGLKWVFSNANFLK
jgi:predicted membrane channel-forming protein YqfA (hemolysin III family)